MDKLSHSGHDSSGDGLYQEWSNSASPLDDQTGILDGTDDIDEEFKALVSEDECSSMLDNEIYLKINDMLQKHGVDTIYRPGASNQELARNRQIATEGYMKDLEDGNLSILDLQEIAYCCDDDRELEEAVLQQIADRVTRRISSEIFVMGMVSLELISQATPGYTIQLTKKTANIADYLLALDRTVDSPWFDLLNEAFGGEDVSPNQVQQLMDDQVATEKVTDPHAKSTNLLDHIFMETDGTLSNEQTVLVARLVINLAMREECDQDGNGEYARRKVELMNVGLSEQQVRHLIDQYRSLL